MKLSSSGLEALIGGPWVFFAVDPPIDRAVPPKSAPRVTIASCVRWWLASNSNSSCLRVVRRVGACRVEGIGSTNHVGAELATGDGIHLDHGCGLKLGMCEVR